MGSRILSRSFQVTKWEGEKREGDESDGEGGADPVHANLSVDSAAMDVDDPQASSENPPGDEEEDDDDESQDDPADVAMVPMADMLNARFESENVSVLPCKCTVNSSVSVSRQAKLFYEEQDLKMITTREIKAGEQIVGLHSDKFVSMLKIFHVSGTHTAIHQIRISFVDTDTWMFCHSAHRCPVRATWQIMWKSAPTFSCMWSPKANLAIINPV